MEKVEEIFEGIIGATEELARQKCESNGFRCRVTNLDGEGMIGTCDLRADRMNLHVKDGMVVEAYIG